MIMRRINLIALFAVFMLATACHDTAEEKKQRNKEEREKAQREWRAAFKVAIMPTLDCLPVVIAYERKLCDSTKIDLRPCMYRAQMDCDTALLNKRVQGSVSDLVRTERLKKKGLALTYPIATNTYWQLFTNKKQRVKSLSQLSDKMVAMTRYSATDRLTDMAVQQGKPKYTVFRIQINDVPLRLNMLLNNSMDAMWLPEPQATVARMKGHPMLFNSENEALHWGVFAFLSEEVGKDVRSRQLQEFIRGYNAACDSINRFGLPHYGDLIVKYCQVPQETVAKLPKLKFQHAEPPRDSDVQKAK